ncbi:MAG: hypothetical protein ABIV36_05500 [Sphingobium limneticum]
MILHSFAMLSHRDAVGIILASAAEVFCLSSTAGPFPTPASAQRKHPQCHRPRRVNVATDRSTSSRIPVDLPALFGNGGWQVVERVGSILVTYQEKRLVG